MGHLLNLAQQCLEHLLKGLDPKSTSMGQTKYPEQYAVRWILFLIQE
jgi:hypothetical protein